MRLDRQEKQRAKRLPAEERRQQILDAAIGVFARMGYHGAGTSDIAAAAGIGEPTIYRYFQNKRDLYIEAVRYVREQITEHWEGIIEGSTSARDALRSIGRWYYEELKRHPDHLVLRFKALTDSSDPEVRRIARYGYLRSKEMVQRLYEQAQAEGMTRQDADAHTLAWLFMAIGAVLDVTHLLNLEDELGPREMEQLGVFFDPEAQRTDTNL